MPLPVKFFKQLKKRAEIICKRCGAKMKIIGVMIPNYRVPAATNSTYLKGELFVM